jgi:hypothetical protein
LTGFVTVKEPEAGLTPLQAPDAVHELVFPVIQEKEASG